MGMVIRLELGGLDGSQTLGLEATTQVNEARPEVKRASLGKWPLYLLLPPAKVPRLFAKREPKREC